MLCLYSACFSIIQTIMLFNIINQSMQTLNMITVFICLWYVKSTKCSIITAFSQVACDILELSDLEQLESRLENQREAVEVFPKLEDLVLNIADVMEPSLVKNHKNNKHKIWCSKHWKNIITRLETWRQQIKQLPVRVCVCAMI